MASAAPPKNGASTSWVFTKSLYTLYNIKSLWYNEYTNVNSHNHIIELGPQHVFHLSSWHLQVEKQKQFSLAPYISQGPTRLLKFTLLLNLDFK